MTREYYATLSRKVIYHLDDVVTKTENICVTVTTHEEIDISNKTDNNDVVVGDWIMIDCIETATSRKYNKIRQDLINKAKSDGVELTDNAINILMRKNKEEILNILSDTRSQEDSK